MGEPSGTVTFLFTDVEGSTRLWESAPEAMGRSLERHDEIVRSAVAAHDGYVFSADGDGFAVAFGRAGDALLAAVDAQLGLAGERWPEGAEISVRMALHTGEVVEREGDYFGPAVNRAARLMALGHGGQVLCSAVTAALVPSGAVFLDLGEHRLRDLSSPQRVFQVGAGMFPPLRSLDAFRSNLPAQASVFVGRVEELSEVAAALEASRVVTLTGVGGVGKTRLAVQVAADLVPGFRDGAWLVELGPVVDPKLLVDVVAGALGVPERLGQSLVASVTDFLRAKRLLVVLDNGEHLLDAVAAFVAGVVANCPHVSVLTTSREGLRVRGERILVVPSLGLPADGSSPEVVGAADAVRLFVERAREAKAGFALDEGNARAVARLVRRLDGIPLAIELAAARARSLTPAELADRLDARFRLLAGGDRTAVERHQTLRRAIDWSYDLLSEAEQHTLNCAAVFAADFDLDSAQAVIGGAGIDRFEVVDLLGRLVDKSLMLAEDRGGVSRYRLLETIRQYGQERLEAAGEAGELRRGYAEHYAAFATAAGDGLRGPDEVTWTGRVEAELDNLRAALGWSVAYGDADVALRIVAPFGLYGTRVGFATGGWAAPVAAMTDARARRLYPQVLAFAGSAEFSAGDAVTAMRTCRAALVAADAAALDPLAFCRVLQPAAAVAQFAPGCFEEARRLASRYVDVARLAGDDWELTLALSLAGALSSFAGDGAAGTTFTDEALGVAARLANPTAVSIAALCAAGVRITTDPDQALRFLASALETAESVGNQQIIGYALAFQAWIYRERSQWRQAAPLVARSLQQFHQAGDQNGSFENLSQAVLILDAIGDDVAAATLHGRVQVSSIPILDDTAAQVAASVGSLRRRLGDDRFEQCAARGRDMDIDDLYAYASEKLRQLAGGP